MMSHLIMLKANEKGVIALKTKRRSETGRNFIFFIIAMFTAILFLSPPASAAKVRYKNPKIRGYALDLCQKWGKYCGKPAADSYCRSKGFRRAVNYKVRHNRPPTRVIGTGQICKSRACDRIVNVTCEKRTKRPIRKPIRGGGGDCGDKCDDTGTVQWLHDDD